MHSRTPHVRLVDLKVRTAGSGMQHLGSDPCDRQQYQHQGPSMRRFDSFVNLFAPNDSSIIDGHCELLRSSRRRRFCVCTRWSRSSLENHCPAVTLRIAILRSRLLSSTGDLEVRAALLALRQHRASRLILSHSPLRTLAIHTG
jgi:hypothetical protein